MSSVEFESLLVQHAETISASTARALWSMLLSAIRDNLLRGRKITLVNLGTLEPYERPTTVYRHPVTGKMTTVAPGIRVRFTPSVTLKTTLKSRPLPKAAKPK